MSFGEDPKGVPNLKKQPALDQIVETESPEKPKQADDKKLAPTINVMPNFNAPAKSPL